MHFLFACVNLCPQVCDRIPGLCFQVNVIHAFGEQIGTKLAKAEEVGAEGNVDESLRLMEEVEELKKQKSSAEVIVVMNLGNVANYS